MDALAIGVIAFAIITMIGGLIFARHANRASEKMQEEEIKKQKNKNR